jgi:hypothetical protein
MTLLVRDEGVLPSLVEIGSNGEDDWELKL